MSDGRGATDTPLLELVNNLYYLGAYGRALHF